MVDSAYGVQSCKKIKRDSCQQLFGTEQGLQNQQTWSTPKKFAFHRLQTSVQKQKARDEPFEKRNNVKSVKLEKYHINVSQGPHPRSCLITGKEKKCILTLASGIDVGPTFINFGLFARPYRLIKSPTFIKFWKFFRGLHIFLSLMGFL